MKYLKIFLFLFLILTAFSDKGMVYIDPSISQDSYLYLKQPKQEAIIIWDGNTEILVIRTQVESEREGLALEVIPLPSKPEDVFLVSDSVFDKLKNLFPTMPPVPAVEEKGVGGREGVTVVLVKEIGAHNITVVKSENPDDFLSWMREHYGEFKMSDRLESVLIDYMLEGYNYFVFDVVNLSKISLIKPIAYKFKTDELYYPLRTTKASFVGYTSIELYLITPWPLKELKGYWISQKEVKDLSEYLPKNLLIFGRAWISKVKKYVPTASLDEDFILKKRDFDTMYFVKKIWGYLRPLFNFTYLKDLREILTVDDGKCWCYRPDPFKEIIKSFSVIFISISGIFGLLIFLYRKIRNKFKKYILIFLTLYIFLRFSLWLSLPFLVIPSVYFFRVLSFGRASSFIKRIL